jgi:predicted dehydrogenase
MPYMGELTQIRASFSRYKTTAVTFGGSTSRRSRRTGGGSKEMASHFSDAAQHFTGMQA